MSKIIYNQTDITQLFEEGKWAHPVTGVKYPNNWNPLTIEGVSVVNEPVQLPEIESLEEIKVRKNREINQSRLSENQTSFTYQGKQVSCDLLSRGDIDAVNGLVSITNSLPPSWVGGWKASDNSIIPIPDLATWISFYGAMVHQGTLNFNKAQTLKAQLEVAYLANDREAMELISW
jgi:hypothetical protein